MNGTETRFQFILQQNEKLLKRVDRLEGIVELLSREIDLDNQEGQLIQEEVVGIMEALLRLPKGSHKKW